MKGYDEVEQLLINVVSRDLCKSYPVYTKKGVIWKNRIDWSRIEVAGNLIETLFGIFTFVKAERIEKIWYWTLRDEQGNEFTIKRDQARKNKKMPRTAKKQIAPPRAFTFNYQLCLPAPKEFIDELLEQIDKAVAEHNDKCRGKNGRVKKSLKWDTWEEVMNKRDNSFETKVNFILGTASDMGNIKSIYNKLANQYHPDKTRKNSNDEFAVIAEYYNLYK